MQVTLISSNRRVKKKVTRDHYWYDLSTKQRLHFIGGQLVFEYDPVQKKSLPKVIDAEEWISENSYDEIKNWIKNNDVELLHENPPKFAVIDVNVRSWNELEDDLYRHKILYEYNATQYKKETHDKQEGKLWQNSPSKWPIRQQH